jgi:hypothetical protein
MRKLYIFIAFMAANSTAYSQKMDNVWLLGAQLQVNALANTNILTFDDSLVITNQLRATSMHSTNASISDSLGNLLFYTNGCYIADRNGDMVINSDSLNPGLVYELSCVEETKGYASSSSALFLKHPTQANLIYLFHIANFFQITPILAGHKERLYYTVIDASANNGLGSVLSKNNLILKDTIQYEGIHAVRHANGRDWWLILGKQYSNQYWTVLFSDKGLKIEDQAIGVPVTFDSFGNFVFSPDGSKLARYNPRDDLHIFDFDRCTGLLSNPVHFQMTNNADNKLGGGTAFSADGHYLYVSDELRLWQFDMWASDPTATLTKIADRELNGPCALGYTITWLELGPDGRIYGAPASGQQCMHRVARPERGGEACEFVQSYYKLTTPHQYMPHFPNYRLGPVDGSACDTLGIDNHPLSNWRYDRAGGYGVDFTSVSWYVPTAWTWDFGDGSGSAERNPSHFYTAAGPYEVCLTVSNAYGADTKCKTVWVGSSDTGEAPAPGEGLRFYPNPTTGMLTWSGAALSAVRLYNAQGRLALEASVTGRQMIDLASLPDGMYLMQSYGIQGEVLDVQKVSLLKR